LQEEQIMAGRGPQTFKKRQKEQQRKEKQQEKIARRLARKDEKAAQGSSNGELPVESQLEEDDIAQAATANTEGREAE
jgi:hypothetical protein